VNAYRELEKLRDWLRDWPDLLNQGDLSGLGMELSDLDVADILDIIHKARDAATLCACATPQAGACNACKLRLALTRAGVPK
jgi:hypothetical protein